MTSLAQVADFARREHLLQARWQRERLTPRRWQLLRDVYSLKLPEILQHGCSPYFLDWDFTPIEYLAWCDIRALGLKLYPQFPAGPYFLDFADPVLQIAVETDGREYHDPAKDQGRDAFLWRLGWRVFRIPGRQTLPAPSNPFQVIAYQDIRNTDEAGDLIEEWGARWSEGFFWALSSFYYPRSAVDPELIYSARRILHRHRYVSFPLDLDDDGRGA